jgi:hypothetical protein
LGCTPVFYQRLRGIYELYLDPPAWAIVVGVTLAVATGVYLVVLPCLFDL